MFIYLAMLALPLPGVFGFFKKNPVIDFIYFYLVLILYILFIGLRFETGSDWPSYIKFFDVSKNMQFIEALRNYDYAFSFLTWLVAHLHMHFYVLLLICAFFSVIGAAFFIKKQPDYWIGLYISAVIFFIPISMGQIRQSVAIGFEFMAITALINKSAIKNICSLSLSFLFHKSFIALMPLFLFSGIKIDKKIIFLLVFCSSVLIYFSFFTFSDFLATYLISPKDSRGFIFRMIPNSLAALFFIFYIDRFKISIQELNLWIFFSILTLVFFVFSFFNYFSQILDRIGFFLIPLQIFIASRISNVLNIRGARKPMFNLLLILVYATYFTLWIYYSPQSIDWLPYITYLE